MPFFIAHRGCPHRCVFCDQEQIAGGDGSLPSASEIRGKVAVWRRSSGGLPVEAAFFGGSFTALPTEDQEKLLLPLQPLLEKGQVASIRVSTRPDALDAQCASFLRRMGVTKVELGVQSLDEEVLEQSGRGHDAGPVGEAIECLKGEGISVGLQLMPGLPGDTAEKSLNTLSAALGLAPDFLRIYPTVVLAGTRLAELFDAGIYRPLTLQQAVTLCKVMLHRALISGVPVVRMGLQPTEDLNRQGTVVAGPYHPAFRQLVEAELRYDLLARLVDDGCRGASGVVVYCAPSRISDVKGQRGGNLDRLLRERGVRVTSVRGDSRFSRFECSVAGPDCTRTGSILSDLNYSHKDLL